MRLLFAAIALAVLATACSGGGSRTSATATPATIATTTPHPEPYGGETQFAATDLFDLSRIAGAQTAGWQTSGNLSGSLAISLPPEWVTSPSDAALTASKPLAPGRTVGICRTVPGWSKLDMSADAAPVDVTTPDANVIRDVIEVLPTNGLAVEVIQIAGSTQCGPNFGKLSIIPRAPFRASVALNGAATVDFPATADEIAIAVRHGSPSTRDASGDVGPAAGA